MDKVNEEVDNKDMDIPSLHILLLWLENIFMDFFPQFADLWNEQKKVKQVVY